MLGKAYRQVLNKKNEKKWIKYSKLKRRKWAPNPQLEKFIQLNEHFFRFSFLRFATFFLAFLEPKKLLWKKLHVLKTKKRASHLRLRLRIPAIERMELFFNGKIRVAWLTRMFDRVQQKAGARTGQMFWSFFCSLKKMEARKIIHSNWKPKLRLLRLFFCY